MYGAANVIKAVQNLLTKAKVVDCLANSVLKKPKQMIQTLVRKIVVYEDKIEIYYNYTDETNPEDGDPRDSYLLSGSDSSVIPGGHGTNTNPNKKNYPGSDSSVMVELKPYKFEPFFPIFRKVVLCCR